MDEDELKFLTLMTAAVLVPVALSAAWYAKVRSTERKKRKKIAEWKTEATSCITAAGVRMLSMLDEPDFTWDKFAEAWKEEDAFLDIVLNQPKY